MLGLEKLYLKINELYQDYYDIIEVNQGEITEEALKKEEEIEFLMENSLESVDEFYYIKGQIESEMDFLISLKDQMINKIKLLDNKLEKTKELIAKVMINNDLTKLEGSLCSIKARVSNELIIKDKEQIPTEYWKERVVKELDKTRIKNTILDNVSIEGAEVKKVNTITFYKRG
jgi:hypothetical protein